jgi:acetyltransferase
MVCDFPEINEFEINPLMVFDEGDGALAVDMRAILKERESEDLLQSSPRSSSIESTTM